MKKENTRPQAFKPGQPGGPGRPKGSVGGRRLILETLDKVLGKERNREKIEQAMQGALDEDPLQFWKEFGQPLLPKEATVDLNMNGGVTSELTLKLEQLTTEALERIAYPDKAGTDRPSKTRKDRSGA